MIAPLVEIEIKEKATTDKSSDSYCDCQPER